MPCCLVWALKHESLHAESDKFHSMRESGALNFYSLVRKARLEDIDCVATAINLRPETLQQIEDGSKDFRIKTFFAFCDYYNIDVESAIGKGELMHFKLT